MEIFNIGIPELLLILLLMLILLGPEGTAASARKLARAIRRFLHSPLWQDIMQTQREIRDIPTRLVRDAGADEFRAASEDIRQVKHEAEHSIRVPLSAGDTTIRKPNTVVDRAPWMKDQPPASSAALESLPEEEYSSKWANLTRDRDQKS